jgi:hypothetical protein
LRNEMRSQGHWIEVRLEGVKCNRSALGARVVVLRKGQPPLWRRVHTDGSYLSANDIRVHFGLGPSTSVEAIMVEWPGGDKEVWKNIVVDTMLALHQGTGSPSR